MPATATTSEWFTSFALPRAARGVKLRLFCFPYVGGGTAAFRPWVGHFGSSVEVQALQLPGRERRMAAPLVDSLPALVGALAPAFEDIDTPFVFFGHSMGGLVAFELMRELRRRRRPMPSLLFASACSAPQIPDYVEPPRSAQSEEEIVAELRRLNGTPEAILDHEELRRLLLPALRADFNIVDLYRYYDEPPLDCPIVALGGMHDSGISVDMLAGWQLQTTRGFELQMFNGDHFYLHGCRDALLSQIGHELARAALLR